MENTEFFFWRDSNGNEVDVIADYGGRLMPVEIKSGKTLNQSFFTGLERWLDLAGGQAFAPALVYGGDRNLTRKGVRVFAWDSAARVLDH